MNSVRSNTQWPYCERRCTYCNFNKYISKSVDENRMERCLIKETGTLIKQSGVKTIDSVFFGGGSPSLASPHIIGAILDTIREQACLPDTAEITLEVNPTPSAINKLRSFKEFGVNRLSIGVQSLCDDALQRLGRNHSVEDAKGCIDVAKELFPWRYSVDLIFGRHLQTAENWEEELCLILPLLEGHISLYQLTIERGTALFKQVSQGHFVVPNEETLSRMYTTAVEFFQLNGLERYEVSNFACKGCESDHNQRYWAGFQYIGVGPGAHGRFTPVGSQYRQSRIQTLEPVNWMYEVEKYGHATRRVVDLMSIDRLEELLMTGLRTRKGVSNEMWKSLCTDGPSLHDLVTSSNILRDLQSSQFLILDDSCLRVSSSGMIVLDSILPELLYTLHQLVKDT